MGVFTALATVLLVLDCILLLGVILIQRGKGGGLSGAFGGLGGEVAFGTRATSTAKKATVILAIIFVLLTIAVSYAHRIQREGLTEEPAGAAGKPAAQSDAGGQKPAPPR